MIKITTIKGTSTHHRLGGACREEARVWRPQLSSIRPPTSAQSRPAWQLCRCCFCWQKHRRKRGKWVWGQSPNSGPSWAPWKHWSVVEWDGVIFCEREYAPTNHKLPYHTLIWDDNEGRCKEEEDRDSFIYKEREIEIQDKKIRCPHSGRRVFVPLGNSTVSALLTPPLQN